MTVQAQESLENRNPMKTATVVPEEEAPSEVTRLGEAYSWQSIAFVMLSVCGLVTGVTYIFGFTWAGRRLLEGEYYWIFIGFFAAAAFLALPARAGQVKVPLYDVVAAVVMLAASFYFAHNAWDMVQAGWSNLYVGIVVWLLMMELARRSGGIPFLLVVFFIGLYPMVADRFPGLFFGVPYEFGHMIEAHIFRAEGMMGITTKIVAEIILGFLVFAGILLATGAGTFSSTWPTPDSAGTAAVRPRSPWWPAPSWAAFPVQYSPTSPAPARSPSRP